MTELTVVYIIVLSEHRKKLTSHTKINYDIISIRALKTTVAHMALL